MVQVMDATCVETDVSIGAVLWVKPMVEKVDGSLVQFMDYVFSCMVRVHYNGKFSSVVRYLKFLNGGLIEGNSSGQPVGFLVYRIMDRMGRHYGSGYGFGALSKARV